MLSATLPPLNSEQQPLPSSSESSVTNAACFLAESRNDDVSGWKDMSPSSSSVSSPDSPWNVSSGRVYARVNSPVAGVAKNDMSPGVVTGVWNDVRFFFLLSGVFATGRFLVLLLLFASVDLGVTLLFPFPSVMLVMHVRCFHCKHMRCLFQVNKIVRQINILVVDLPPLLGTST